MFSRSFGNRPRRVAFTLFDLLVVIALIALLAALLLPAVQRVRIAATRTQSINHLKEIGLAAHAFHDAMNKLPYNGTEDHWAKAGDAGSGSVFFQLLPYVEQANVFNACVGHDAKNNSTVNAPEYNVPLKVYLCPGRGRPGVKALGNRPGAVTDYGWNLWLNDPDGGKMAAPDNNLGLTSITDGTSNTILDGEKSLQTGQYTDNNASHWDEGIFDGGWGGTGRPNGHVQPDAPSNRDLAAYGSPFPSVCPCGLCDGSVRTIPYGFNIANALKPNSGAVNKLP